MAGLGSVTRRHRSRTELRGDQDLCATRSHAAISADRIHIVQVLSLRTGQDIEACHSLPRRLESSGLQWLLWMFTFTS